MNRYWESFKDCFKYWKRFLIAAFFNYIPFVNLMAIGYFLDSLRLHATQQDIATFPVWNGFLSYFLRGFKLLVVGIVWMIPLALVFYVSTLVPSLAWYVVLGVMGFIFLYLLPSIFVHESLEFGGSFSAKIFDKIFTLDYLKHWVLINLVNVPIALLGNAFAWTVPFFGVYLYMLIARVYGDMYREKG